MKDLRERLEKVRSDATYFARMSNCANDAEKRELFARLADELAIEALEPEPVVNRQSGGSGSSNQESGLSPTVPGTTKNRS